MTFDMTTCVLWDIPTFFRSLLQTPFIRLKLLGLVDRNGGRVRRFTFVRVLRRFYDLKGKMWKKPSKRMDVIRVGLQKYELVIRNIDVSRTVSKIILPYVYAFR